MKNITNYSVASISLLVLLLGNLSAKEKSSSNKAEISAPVPTKTITPKVNGLRLKDGLTVEINFRVNKAGKAVKVKPTVPYQALPSQERNFAAALASALTQWQFEPARDESGQHIDQKVKILFTYNKDKGRTVSAQAMAKK